MPRVVTTAPADNAMVGARGPRGPKQAARKCFHYCLILLPNYRYLSEFNALELLRYNTTLNAFGKSEFHLVGYIYSITRAQQAKLKCMLGLSGGG